MNPCVQSSKILPNRSQFLSSYRRHQAWSLPDSIIYYITKKPSSAMAYKKLVQTCKYFFIKNSILILADKSLAYYNNKWHICVNGEYVNLKNIFAKLWIIYGLNVKIWTRILNDADIITSIIPQIYRNDATELYLYCRNITLNDFSFLASKCKEIVLNFNAVKNDDVFLLAKIGDILPSFFNLIYLQMIHTPQNFDINNFYSYILKNNKTKIYLDFSNQVSDEYKHRLQTIVTEIIETENRRYIVPYIDFRDSDQSLDNELWKLYGGIY